MPTYDEETPLLGSSRSLRNGAFQSTTIDTSDIHLQFCMLAGVPPSNLPYDARQPKIAKRSLYGRAIHKRNAQNRTYLLTASLSNSLLLSQVVLGAALTGLGASGSSHILITVFGALNTIIAGVVAYLKSRGQPMRARMYRDDLDRVVDEIENSEVMWLGIQSGVHGYDEIAIDDSVSVRSEVARLTRLYDKVVKNNTMNDPDMYLNAVTDGANAALRARPQLAVPETPSAPSAVPQVVTSAPDPSAPTGIVVPPVATPDDDFDASPASAPPKPKTPEPPADCDKSDSASCEEPTKSKKEKKKADPVRDDDSTGSAEDSTPESTDGGAESGSKKTRKTTNGV